MFFLLPGALIVALRLAGGDTTPPVPLATRASIAPSEDDAPAAPASAFGDASLRGQIDLAAMQIAAGRYQAALDEGRTAVLTLDPVVQAAAEKVLAGADAPYGCVVVMSLDGRLLALAGTSTAEPELDAVALCGKPWAPSASLFKIVTAAALVDAGVDPAGEVCYHGGVRGVDESNLADDARADTTCHDLTYGLARSQNAILAKLAAKHLDAAALERTARALGYGDAPAFALAVEPSRAEIPEDALERARAAAGFWHSELSPIGAAIMTGTIATRGLRVTPRIVESILDARGEVTALPGVAPVRALDQATAEAVAGMMAATTTWGTARKAFHDARGRAVLDVAVAGKTGSLSRKSPFLDYSWFAGFAPAGEPRVVVAVLLGNSATYRIKAHTAARIVLQATFGQ